MINTQIGLLYPKRLEVGAKQVFKAKQKSSCTEYLLPSESKSKMMIFRISSILNYLLICHCYFLKIPTKENVIVSGLLEKFTHLRGPNREMSIEISQQEPLNITTGDVNPQTKVS